MIEQLGPYRIDKQIGRGGMGAVYAGVNEETGETAAIKILAAAFAEDLGFRSRFLTEIETLKQLRHRNIVRLLGDGEQDGQLFYVMELVDGPSLQEELQAGHQYDWQETTEIAIQICEALKHAHAHGVIHRDLKPANLLRTPDNQIKLTDFGIAKLFGGSHLTAAGSVVGTADFMSPEQAEGLGVTHRSDLYSLGTVMFTLLARRPPFGGTSLPQVVHKLRFEEAPSVRRFSPQVPSELEQIINQLLSKAPDQRVATALVLANRLRAMQHGLANLDSSVHAAGPASDCAKVSAAPSPGDEQVTRISNSGRVPNTELNPTAVDDFELRDDVRHASGSESWNDATLATGDAVSGGAVSGGATSGGATSGAATSGGATSGARSSGTPVSGDGQTSDGVSRDAVGNSQPTIVDTPQPVNRFTTIEADQYRKRQETIDKPAKWRESITVIVLSVLLVAVIGAIALSLRPESADSLYSEIVKCKATETIEDARNEIEEFLARFPDDPRAVEVADYQLAILSERHFRKLVRQARKNTLWPVEDQFVQAMRNRTKDPAAAREGFLELMDADVADLETEEVRRCIDYARFQLGQLSDTPETGTPESGS